jgi:hypothetical protein
MKRIPLLAFLALPLLLVSCGAPQLMVTPRYGQFEVDGDFGIGSAPVVTGSLDQAGLGDTEEHFGIQADVKWGSPHLSVSTQSSEHSGSGTLDVALTQGGVTIPVGAQVDSDLELGLHQGALTFDLIPTDLLELGIGLGVTAVDIDLQFRSGVNEIETDETVPLPVLAVRGGVQIWRLEVGALATGIQGDYDDGEVDFFDVDARAMFRFLGDSGGLAGHVVLGYRWVDLDLEYEDSAEEVVVDSTFSGAYIGLALTL